MGKGDVDHHFCSVEGGLVHGDQLWVESHTNYGVVSEAIHTEEGEKPGKVQADVGDDQSDPTRDKLTDVVSHFLLILIY